jgi:N-acetyl-gamma-glutamyl-phosphate reductase
MTISAVVVGASGYAGGDLFRLLVNHPDVRLVGAHDVKNVGSPVHKVHPNLRGIVDMVITNPDYAEMGKSTDAVFVATPHGVAMKFVPKVLEGGARVIDLSADYRFDDPKVFERYYTKHESPHLKAIYGLPELYRPKIKNAKFIANPGCYPTAAILSLAPLVKENLIDLEHIIIDAKSGTSGAGAAPSEVTHHPTCGASMRAYAATTHRHGPEINQELSKLAGKGVKANFTPHLIPIVRGILSTSHVFMRKSMSKEDLLELYRNFYRGEPFVRVLDELPQINFIVGSNYCDIGFEPDAATKRLVVVSTIDNLIKGASGQAIQNMNLMFGIDEVKGLEIPPLRP